VNKLHGLYPVREIRAIEQAALAAAPPGALMRRAGAAAAALADRLLPSGGKVLVLAGPGNNGGDALETAALLAYGGYQVCIHFSGDAGFLSANAAAASKRASASPAVFRAADMTAHWDLVIDGLFGIGLARPITGELAALVSALNNVRCPVLALDVPSGLDADSGAVVGPDGVAVRASHTITFIADKPGLHTADGCDHAGQVEVATLSVEPGLAPAPLAVLADAALFAARLAPRRENSHKGSYGDCAILGGAHSMAGAVMLAARSAALAGAGRVYAGFIDTPPAYDPFHPEIMCRHAADLDLAHATVVAGPGMGTGADAHGLLALAMGSAAPLVLDADALNMVAADAGLHAALVTRTAATLMTPHPLEAARLLGCNAVAVQADRLGAARTLAASFNAMVVLKGAGSVLARPDGFAVINNTGNPALATAGTGDVLAGLCGALLAQHWAPWEALMGAVWLHGAAADLLVEQGVGPVGMVASELPAAIRLCLNRLIRSRSGS
jgi:hydroxyethylthiazole kinase-like uncharacterized protein yjeF